MTMNVHNVLKNSNKFKEHQFIKYLYIVKTIKLSKSNIIYTFRIFVKK